MTESTIIKRVILGSALMTSTEASDGRGDFFGYNAIIVVLTLLAAIVIPLLIYQFGLRAMKVKNVANVGVQANPTTANEGVQAVALQSDRQVQSQTSYTSLRGSNNPRFQPVPDHTHGAWAWAPP